MHARRPPAVLAPYALGRRPPDRSRHGRNLAACVRAGELAWARGARLSDCPYTAAEPRSAWCEGFRAARDRHVPVGGQRELFPELRA